MSGLRIIKPGALTLIQDLGRFGYQHLGLSPGGAMDEQAFLWANQLLGNAPDSAALEIALGGLQLETCTDTRMALTGADFGVTRNGEPLAPWQTHRVMAGDRLCFGFSSEGARGYLAVAGGLLIEPTFGSASTVVRDAMGGLHGVGRSLAPGDCLACADTQGATEPDRAVPARFIPDYRAPLTLRVLEGQQRHTFSEVAVQRFYANAYTVSARSDRMGVRLEGEAVPVPPTGMVSEGVPFGAIQIPPDGQPLVLLKDRQTIGGYPKLGTLHPLDAFAVSQRLPGCSVRFQPVDYRACVKDWQAFCRFFQLTD